MQSFFRKTILVLLMTYVLPFVTKGQEQLPDSSGKRVTIMKPVDSLFQVQQHPSIYGAYAGGFMDSEAIFHAGAAALKVPMLVRKIENRDWVFYFYCALLLF